MGVPGAAAIFKGDMTSSSLLALLHGTRRRTRINAAAGITIFLLATLTWMYCGLRTYQVSTAPQHHWATTKDNTSGYHKEDHPANASSLIPPKIWQIMLPKKKADKFVIDPEKLKDTASWLAMNTDYA